MNKEVCTATATLSKSFIEYLISQYFENASDIELKVNDENKIVAKVVFSSEVK